ncbi:hypothetical protein FOVSG1_015383 [Fusarium oxysporum f. sp. vasinfectum]
MQTKSFFTALLAVLPTVHAFKFTGPDPLVGKDVSPKFDLEWYSEPDKLNKIGAEITHNVADLFLSDRQYKMKVSENTKDMLRPFAKELAAHKLFSFRAIFKDGDEDVPYYSQNYTVIGLH